MKVEPDEEFPDGFFEGVPVDHLPASPDYDLCRKIRDAAVSAGYRRTPRIRRFTSANAMEWHGCWPLKDGKAILWLNDKPFLSYRGASPDLVSAALHAEMEFRLKEKFR